MHSFKLLHKGDTVGIAAVSSPFDKERFEAGVQFLQGAGFLVRYDKAIFEMRGYLAGSDDHRAQSLHALFEDNTVRAILFARGGFGAQRIIPLLDRKLIRKHPKLVVGFSDLTPLLHWLAEECHMPTMYGPVVTQLGEKNATFTRESFLQTVTSAEPLRSLTLEGSQTPRLQTLGSQTLCEGEASGRLTGGCLSLITSSIGTFYELKTDNTLLFLEDANEKLYTIDRMLTQLLNSGKLDKVRGIVFGESEVTNGSRNELDALLQERLRPLGIPVISRFPSGHGKSFTTLPLGVKATLNASAQHPTLTLESSLFT